MAWDPIDPSELTPGFTILKHMRQAWNCLLWLFGQVGTLAALGIPNGSFEVDSDNNGQADNWVMNTYPGGTGGVVSDVPAHGNRAIRLVHPGGAGNGGGYYESDYCACSDCAPLMLSWIHWASAAGMHNQVRVRFFDKAKVSFAASTIYDSVENPTTPTYFAAGVTPPAGARYYKLDLIGGDPDTDVAGSAWFDGVAVAGVEMFVGRFTSFTIPPTFGGAEEWTDCASVAVPTPYIGFPVRLTFTATLQQTGGIGVLKMRFRSGGYVSNELSVADGSSASFSLTGVPDPSGRVTVAMQMSGGAAGTGSVPAGNCLAKVDISSM